LQKSANFVIASLGSTAFLTTTLHSFEPVLNQAILLRLQARIISTKTCGTGSIVLGSTGTHTNQQQREMAKT
jgi:hypothetical protein